MNEQRKRARADASPMSVPGPRSEPVTVRPPFDPEEFARNADSSIRLTEDASAPPLPPTMPPPAGLPQYPADLPPLSSPRSIRIHADAIPELAVAIGDLDWFDLSPHARAVLRWVNGRDSVATICEQSGLAPRDAIAVLDELAREGLIATCGTER